MSSVPSRKSSKMNSVDQKIAQYEPQLQQALQTIRNMVHQVAQNTVGCGQIVEALKWGQISFLTEKPKSGTTLRIDKNANGTLSLYVNCNSNMIAEASAHYPDVFTYVGAREIVLPDNLSSVSAPLEHIVAMALTYHKNKRTK